MVNISLTLGDTEPSETDRLCRQLRAELLGLGVDRIDLVSFDAVPEGAKSVDPGTVAGIVVAVSSSPVLIQLGRVLRDWVNRSNGRKLVVRDGERSIEISGRTDPNDHKIIDAFFGAENSGRGTDVVSRRTED